MNKAWSIAAGGLLLAFLGCSTGPATQEERQAFDEECTATVARFKAADMGLDRFFKSSAGYAVFPSVGKGAIGVGGAHGRGQVYEGGTVIGYTTLTQVTIGLQLGGQAYSELIFFKNQAALEDFKGGNYEFSAQASAVAATAGASTDADYTHGVLVFTLTQGGLMYEASVGGQKFSFTMR